MKFTALTALALATAGIPLFAQMQDNSERTMTCNNGGNHGDGARHCDIREQTMPSIGRLTLDSGPNGSTTVKGWLRSDVLVRTRVETRAASQSAADIMASQVVVNGSGGEVRATGPETVNDDSWSVSYEIFAPQNTDLNLKTSNGSLALSDVRGQLRFAVTNGSVHLKRVAGDVSGTTANGSIQAELAGGNWEGRQLELNAGNGSVTVAMPSYYSAHLLAETGNGRVQSDFPQAVTGELKSRRLDFNLGSGGPLIHITTGNGSVRLKRSDAQ